MTKLTVRVLSSIFLVVAAISITGCGDSTTSVSGSVSLDGKPIDNGTITFASKEKNTVRIAAQVVDGKYALEGEKGPPPGAYSVEITWNKKTGRKVSDGDSGKRDETVQALPDKFNKATTLTADITSGKQVKDFALTSK